MQNLPIRAVLFDAGNTLLHLDYGFIAALLAQHGHRVAPLDIRIAEYTAKARIDHLLAPERTPPESLEALLWPDDGGQRPSYFAVILRQLGINDGDAAPILDALQVHNVEQCLWRVVEPDTPDVLAQLCAGGFTLAVISNADGRVEQDIARRGLGQYFTTIIDSQVVGAEKPHPAIFRLALGRLDIAPHAAVYIGDVFGIDILGARGAGLHAVLLDALGRYPAYADCHRIARLSDLFNMLPARAVDCPKRS